MGDEPNFHRMGNEPYHPYDISYTCDDDGDGIESWKTNSK